MVNLATILCFPAAVAFLLESITPGAPSSLPCPSLSWGTTGETQASLRDCPVAVALLWMVWEATA